MSLLIPRGKKQTKQNKRRKTGGKVTKPQVILMRERLLMAVLGNENL